jgi:S1-C subfamily serine protease
MKRIVSVLSLLCFSACCSVQNPENTNNIPTFPLSSFTLIQTTVTALNLESNKVEIKQKVALSSGAIVHKNKKGSFILTTGHSCSPPKELALKAFEMKKALLVNKMIIKTHHNKPYKATIVKIDSKQDLCMLWVEGLTNLPSVELSRRAPKLGERVFNLASPHGIFNKNFCLVYDGYYAGENIDRSWYSFFSTHGSSGSMVLNRQGKLIGIITHADPRVEAGLGSDYHKTVKFVQKNTK